MSVVVVVVVIVVVVVVVSALWSKDEHRVMCWQLDPTEGPGRVRRRMMRAPRTVNDRHFLQETDRECTDDTGERN